MSAEKPKVGIIAIDIEATGRNQSDPVFAIGFATAPIDIEDFSEIKTFSAGLNLRKQPSESWSELWDNLGFERRCFDEFWSKHQNILDQLQDPANIELFHTRDALTQRINDILQECEEMYEDTVLVTDTTLFDTVRVGASLIKKHIALNFNRNGTYRCGGGIEVDSFISGIFSITDPLDWKALGAEVDTHIKPQFEGLVEHDHDPKNDAKYILLKYLAAVRYAKTLQGNKKQRTE